MTARVDRRRFLAGALTSPWLASAAVAAAGEEQKPVAAGRTADIHIHLFGIGDSNSGCSLSKKITDGPVFKLLTAKLKGWQKQLSEKGGASPKTLDETYVEVLAGLLAGSGLDKGSILAQDAAYDRRGKPDWERTHFFIPNRYLFEVVAKHAKLMVPCVSINPDREDALAELKWCAERGARLLKIHPPTQGVDISDKRHTEFFRDCARRKIVVLVHTGHEHSAPTFDIDLANPQRLELALNEGCTVVACHCGTGWPTDKPDMLVTFLDMLKRHENLYGDTSILGSIGRAVDAGRLRKHDWALKRLVHGSDFPFPSSPLAFTASIGPVEAARIQGIKNPLQQDLALKGALGFGRASAERAYRMATGVS
jgi:hypothetical protein